MVNVEGKKPAPTVAVCVTNCGRLATTIHGVGFEQRVRPRDKNYLDAGLAEGTEHRLPCRLEPSDHTITIYDWPAFEVLLTRHGQPAHVVPYARSAGKVTHGRPLEQAQVVQLAGALSL